MERAATYTVHLDKAWSLEDLYVFPRTYEQVYFAIYSLDPNHEHEDAERIAAAYKAFPWQGGYSAVNFYNQLKFTTKKRERPSIERIEYASPGYLELALILTYALNLEKIVKSVAASLETANSTYTEIVKGMQARKLMRLRSAEEIRKLKASDRDYVRECARKMAKVVPVSDIENINKRTGDPYVSLKILLSLYRRVKILAGYQNSGKADFRNRR